MEISPKLRTGSKTYIAHVSVFQDKLKEIPVGRIPFGSGPW